MPPLHNKNLAGFLYAVLAAIGFSFSIIFAKKSYDYGTNPQSVLLVRFLLLSLLMGSWNYWQKTSLRITPRLMLSNLVLSALYFIGIGSYLTAITFLPVSFAVLIFYTFPIVVALLTALLARRWPHPLEMFALMLAFAGLFIALEIKPSGLSGTELSIGLVFAVMASLGIALNMVASGYLLIKLPTTVFSFYMGVGTTFLALIAVISSSGLKLPVGYEGWWTFSTMLLSFIIGFLATYKSVQLIGSLRTSTVMNLEPIATILIAILLLHEVLTLQHIIGGLLVLIAILLAQWPQIQSVRRAGHKA